MLIKVIKTTKAAETKEGISAKTYEADNVYDIFSDLVEVFVAQGWGVEFKEEYKIEEKSIEKASENKAVDKSPENKAFDKKIEVKTPIKKKKATKKNK